MSLNTLAEKMQEALGNSYPPEHENWMTFKEGCEFVNVAYSTFRDRVLKLKKEGKVEVKKFASRASGKQTDHFRLLT